MAVARPRRACHSGLQLLHGFSISPRLGQRLRRHEIGRRVVGILLDQDIEFLQRRIYFAAVRQFHRDAVTRKAVLRVKGENLF